MGQEQSSQSEGQRQGQDVSKTVNNNMDGNAKQITKRLQHSGS
jgi:hypothetical protein